MYPFDNKESHDLLYSDPLNISFTERELDDLLHCIYSDQTISSCSKNQLSRKIQYAISDYHRNYEIMLEAQRIVRNFSQYKQRSLSTYDIYAPYLPDIDPSIAQDIFRPKVRICCSERLIHCEQALRFIFNHIPENEIELQPMRDNMDRILSNPSYEIDREEFNRLLHSHIFLNDDSSCIKINDSESKHELGFFKD